VLHGSGIVGGKLHNEATITGDDASGITLTGNVSGKGDYKGKVTFQGMFSPGDSPALIQLENVVFGATNRLEMEIGGRMRGTEYDALDGKIFDLGGLLDVSLIDLGSGVFAPKLGDFLDLIDADHFNSDFAGFNLPVLGTGLMWEHVIDLEGNGMEAYRLLVAPGTSEVPEPGSMLLLVMAIIPLVILRSAASRAS
jgi:hypothetical protein